MTLGDHFHTAIIPLRRPIMTRVILSKVPRTIKASHVCHNLFDALVVVALGDNNASRGAQTAIQEDLWVQSRLSLVLGSLQTPDVNTMTGAD